MTGSEVRCSHLVAACHLQVPAVSGVLLVVVRSRVGVDRGVLS